MSPGILERGSTVAGGGAYSVKYGNKSLEDKNNPFLDVQKRGRSHLTTPLSRRLCFVTHAVFIPGAYLIFGLFRGCAYSWEGAYFKNFYHFSRKDIQILSKFIGIFHYTTKCNMTILSNKSFLLLEQRREQLV